jgi:hypothetical protein
LAGTAATVLILLPIAQPALPGRWCPASTEWLVCYRDWLVPLSGWAAALAAAGYIAFERHKRWVQDEQALDAARMRLAVQLELMARRYIRIYFDIANTILSREPTSHRNLPAPAFATDAGDLAILPPAESEAIFSLALDVERANDLSNFLCDVALEFDQAAQSMQIDAANAAVKAVTWRNRLGDLVGWKAMDVEALNYDTLVADAAKHEDLHTPHDD